MKLAFSPRHTLLKTVLTAALTITLTACAKETPPPTKATAATAVAHDMSKMNDMAHMAVKTDEEFINGMIPHHQEAVDTSALILKNTKNPELAKFTQAVVTGQSAEIVQMKQWHQAWFNKAYVTDGSYMAMMGDLNQYKTASATADTAYIKGMIAHHQGAVEMAKQAQGFTKRAEIKTMAQAIIDTQTKEITMLQSWLTKTH